jgi:type III pantothenate kinase
MREEIGENPVRTLGTGGLSLTLQAELRGILDEVDPDLTLEGLRLIYDRNR